MCGMLFFICLKNKSWLTLFVCCFAGTGCRSSMRRIKKKRRVMEKERTRTSNLKRTSSVWFTSGKVVRLPTWAGLRSHSACRRSLRAFSLESWRYNFLTVSNVICSILLYEKVFFLKDLWSKMLPFSWCTSSRLWGWPSSRRTSSSCHTSRGSSLSTKGRESLRWTMCSPVCIISGQTAVHSAPGYRSKQYTCQNAKYYFNIRLMLKD